jgi:predicted membrane protein
VLLETQESLEAAFNLFVFWLQVFFEFLDLKMLKCISERKTNEFKEKAEMSEYC